MADIFVSYARADKERVARLVAAFEAQGWSIWWDPVITPGQEFDRRIAAELDAAKAVVVVWTPQSVDSRWVRGEARLAADRGILVPVRFDNAKLPIDALALHTTDLDDWRGNQHSEPFQDLLRALKPLVDGASVSSGDVQHVEALPPRRASRPSFKVWHIAAAVVGVVLVGGAIAFVLTSKSSAPRSAAPARQIEAQSGGSLLEKVGRLRALVQKDRYGAAFPLAQQVMASAEAKNNPDIQDLWHKIDLPIKPLVSEDGATVYFKPYEDADGPWIKGGATPFTKAVDAPRGVLSLKVEKPGFRTGYFVIHNPGPSVDNDPPDPPIAGVTFNKVPLPLAAEGLIPDDMVLVPHTDIPVYLMGWSANVAGNDQQDIPAFAIAKDEVTNQQFKEFVDAGGYDNQTYWDGLKFEDNGREMTWAEARKKFVDETGRPGPAGWQLSTYPAGAADLPVGGISWYEAVAYARFRGQMLPTIHHWVRAAFAPNEAWFNTAPSVALASRFSANGPISAKSETGLGPWGTYNMAGNVREWVWNFAGDRALVLGGDWIDYATLFQTTLPTSPMERLPQDGMRLMRTLPGAEVNSDLLKPITLLDTSNLDRKPVSDEAFEAMRYQFTTSHAEPEKITVQQVKQTPLWNAEEVVLKYAGGDSTTLYIIKPQSHRNPLQPIIYGPPGDCCFAKRPDRNALEQMRPPADTIVNSGRALVIPIWAETYERAEPAPTTDSESNDLYRRAALGWYQDISNTLDYLDTRPDIDMQKSGFMGFSYGAALEGPIVLATEGRLKTGILISGGLVPTVIHPMADAINYVPHIKVPMLMINGRYDHIFSYEQSQKRMFDLLGTPASEKKHIVYDVGHFAFPSNSIVLDISDWLDKYLGPVNETSADRE